MVIQYVISAQFMNDDSYLVTSGELDNTIMIWRYKDGNNSPYDSSTGNGKHRDADFNDDLERESTYRKMDRSKYLLKMRIS